MPAWTLAALLTGSAAAAAVLVVVAAFVPTTPDLADAIARLHARQGRRERVEHTDRARRLDRFGGWVAARSGSLPGLGVPYADLDLLGMTSARFHGLKGSLALLGLAAPSMIAAWSALLGRPIGFVTPVAVSLAAGVGLWFLPHALIRRDAQATRQRFARTITAYIDLVVLERLSGATLAASIIEPATIADAPLFRRIRQTLDRNQLERKPPWTALRELAEDIELTELRELADTMELSGTRSAPMAEQLKARAGDIRNSWLNRDIEAAGAASQRQVAATGLLLLFFLVFVGAPALLLLLQ